MDECRNRYMCNFWPRGQSRIWKGQIVIVSDRFLILSRGRRNATRRALKRVNGKAALDPYVMYRSVYYVFLHFLEIK